MQRRLELQITHAGYRQTFKDWQISPRIITDHELVFVTNGIGEIMIDGKKFRVKGGDLLLFRPHVLHSLSTDTQDYMEFYFFHFLLPADTEIHLPYMFHTDSYHSIKGLFRKVIDAHKQNDPLSVWRKSLYSEQIICELFTELQTQKEPIDVVRIRKVCDHIQSDPCRNITLEELSNLAGIKKTRLLQAFRKITGTTPHQYILTLRLECAKELLLETTLSISEIATRCGFSDPLYFSRCFKKHFSCPPRQFRQQHESTLRDLI